MAVGGDPEVIVRQPAGRLVGRAADRLRPTVPSLLQSSRSTKVILFDCLGL